MHLQVMTILKTVELPDSITEIKDGTFDDDDNLESIKFPKNLKTIGEHAFTWCRSIKSLELPDSVTEIGEYAFSICYGLEAIHLSKGLTSVVYGTFVDCSKLKDITIPENVTKIDTDAFKGCQALRSVYYSRKFCKNRETCDTATIQILRRTVHL